MSPVVTDLVDDVLGMEELERAWHGPSSSDGHSTGQTNNAQLTITRNGASDFQDRQVYLFVDDEALEMTRGSKVPPFQCSKVEFSGVPVERGTSRT